MADALCREYHLGCLPTELLGMDLPPTQAILWNARLLSYRNEQARIASLSDDAGGSGVSIADKHKAKQMKSEQRRIQALKERGLI